MGTEHGNPVFLEQLAALQRKQLCELRPPWHGGGGNSGVKDYFPGLRGQRYHTTRPQTMRNDVYL